MTDSLPDLTRRVHEALNVRDLDTILSLMSEDVEAAPRIAILEGELHGHEGIRRWWALMYDAFAEQHNEILDIEELGDGVLVKFRSRTRARQSDTPLEVVLWQGALCRDGKFTWWANFLRRTEALAALQARQAESSPRPPPA